LQPTPQSIDLGNAQATHIAVDQSGQYAALSRHATALELTVLSFARPTQTHCFPLNLKRDPVGLKWHPNDTNQLAVVRHNRCELLFWNTTKMQLSSVCTLGGYVRPITSFDWSPVAPYLLVTSSADQFRAICIWDLRDLSRPAQAIESLSDPSVVKWNRLSHHYFASAHRSGVRLWDLRVSIMFLFRFPRFRFVQIGAGGNISEPYLMDRCALSKTQTPPTVLDFDWSPIVDHELVTVTDEGMLAVWHTKQPNCPQQQIGPTDVRFVRVFYAPSGNQILTLPDKVGWPKHGLGVWNAHNFQNTAPRLWRFDGSQSVSDHPLPSDPVVMDVAWRTCVTSYHESMQLNSAEETEECFKPEMEFTSANGSDNSTSDNSQTELVTLSVDHTLRIYPIQSDFVHGSKLPEDVPVDSTDSSREKHSGAGDAVSDSSTSFVAQNAPAAISSRRHPGSVSGFTRHKASFCYIIFCLFSFI
ncbi:WD repeat-containing protein 59, partial [Paragonimus westermani]